MARSARAQAADASAARPARSSRSACAACSGAYPVSAPEARAGSKIASPACGPSAMPTATARLTSTTGDGESRASVPYSAAICGQSVASKLSAAACSAAIAASIW